MRHYRRGQILRLIYASQCYWHGTFCVSFFFFFLHKKYLKNNAGLLPHKHRPLCLQNMICCDTSPISANCSSSDLDIAGGHIQIIISSIEMKEGLPSADFSESVLSELQKICKTPALLSAPRLLCLNMETQDYKLLSLQMHLNLQHLGIFHRISLITVFIVS